MRYFLRDSVLSPPCSLNSTLPDSARNLPVSLCKNALPGFFWMSTFGTDAAAASFGISDLLSFIAVSGTSESRALTISFARDVRELSNTVPSLLKDHNRILAEQLDDKLFLTHTAGAYIPSGSRRRIKAPSSRITHCVSREAKLTEVTCE